VSLLQNNLSVHKSPPASIRPPIEEAVRSAARVCGDRGGAKMASNKGKTHMAALPVNVPPETNGGRLAYPQRSAGYREPASDAGGELRRLASGWVPISSPGL